jgi:hypothetical protein
MKCRKWPLRRPGQLLLIAVWTMNAGNALAGTVIMPTRDGPRQFDSSSFASAIQAGPSGAYGCFTAGTLSHSCTVDSLQSAVLGADLTVGLSLGPNAEITLVTSAVGSELAIWEAGSIAGAGDDSFVSVHTAAGWSAEQTFGGSRLAMVQNDTKPSGYQTNYGSFVAADFGLATDAVFDAVRIRSLDAHPDILAVAVFGELPPVPVPEPHSSTMLLAGLLAVGLLMQRRSAARPLPPA